jgi:hypothetical protein
MQIRIAISLTAVPSTGFDPTRIIRVQIASRSKEHWGSSIKKLYEALSLDFGDISFFYSSLPNRFVSCSVGNLISTTIINT